MGLIVPIFPALQSVDIGIHPRFTTGHWAGHGARRGSGCRRNLIAKSNPKHTHTEDYWSDVDQPGGSDGIRFGRVISDISGVKDGARWPLSSTRSPAFQRRLDRLEIRGWKRIADSVWNALEVLISHTKMRIWRSILDLYVWSFVKSYLV